VLDDRQLALLANGRLLAVEQRRERHGVERRDVGVAEHDEVRRGSL